MIDSFQQHFQLWSRMRGSVVQKDICILINVMQVYCGMQIRWVENYNCYKVH